MPRSARLLLLRHQDDRRLTELVAAGHERAFEVIVARHRGPLLRHCERVVGASAAEDVLQQALISAHRALARGDDVRELGPWLHRIAHNAALSALRAAVAAEEPLDAAAHAGSESAADAVERRERLRETVASVRALPRRQRDALLMHVGEHRSYEEIAAELGLTPGAVRQLLNRARVTLRSAVTALTPADLLLRWGATEAQAAGGFAVVAGGAGVMAKGAAVTATVAALAGGGAAVRSTGEERARPERAAPAAGPTTTAATAEPAGEIAADAGAGPRREGGKRPAAGDLRASAPSPGAGSPPAADDRGDGAGRGSGAAPDPERASPERDTPEADGPETDDPPQGRPARPEAESDPPEVRDAPRTRPGRPVAEPAEPPAAEAVDPPAVDSPDPTHQRELPDAWDERE